MRYGFTAMAWLGLLLAGMYTGALAQDRAVDPAAVRAARQLMTITGAERSFESILAVMRAQITLVVVQQNPGKEKQVREILKPIMEDAARRKEEVVSQAARLYAKQFTVAEMNEISAFYKTPIGRKLVARLPVIMQESIRIGQEWGQKLGADIINRFKEEARKRGLN